MGVGEEVKMINNVVVQVAKEVLGTGIGVGINKNQIKIWQKHY